MLDAFKRRLLGQPPPATTTAPQPPTPPQTPDRTPGLRDFITLTEAEAMLLIEIEIGAYVSGDSRLTPAQRLAEVINEEWDASRFLLGYWASHSYDVDAKGLAAKVLALTGRQVQSLNTAVRRANRLIDKDEDEQEAVRRVGLI